MFGLPKMGFTNKYFKYIKYPFYVSLPFVWYYLGTYDRQILRNDMYNRGRSLSQKFKLFPYWDRYMEPIIIRQFSTIFTAGNSFIKGMLSDNEDADGVHITLTSYRHEIDDELETFDNKIRKINEIDEINKKD